jgi:putative hydrolase of the HAD superfamily
MIKTIIFDLGKVLVPFEIERALNHFTGASDLSSEEIREKAYQIKENELYHCGQISAEELFRAFKRFLHLRMNFESFVDTWNSIFLLQPILSKDLIEQLSRQYRLIILSDTNQLHFDFVRSKFPDLRYFDEFVLSHEVGAMKPSPKMYQAAIEAAGCRAEECFFTDDKKENIAGAKKFGINAIRFISAEQFGKHLIDSGFIKK